MLWAGPQPTGDRRRGRTDRRCRAAARVRSTPGVATALLALVAFLALPSCSSTHDGRVDVSLTWASPGAARAYGRGECARRPEADVVRVHYFDATEGDPDEFQQVDVHCRRAGVP
jgi:hypothetical protein